MESVETTEEPAGEAEAPLDPERPHVPTASERLEAAVQNYQTNRHGMAMQQLAILAIDPDIPSKVRQDARVYLGEILYIQGDVEGAKQLFEQVLTEEPGYQIDRFRHPPDVCGHFEYVRTYMVPINPPPPPTTMVVLPMPASGYSPFAAYQFKYSTPQRWPMFVGQAGFGVASVALFGVLWSDHAIAPSGQRQLQYEPGDTDQQRQLQVLKGTQWAVTTGFLGMWAWGSLDARRHWRLNMAVQPAEDGVSFMGGATFKK